MSHSHPLSTVASTDCLLSPLMRDTYPGTHSIKQELRQLQTPPGEGGYSYSSQIYDGKYHLIVMDPTRPNVVFQGLAERLPKIALEQGKDLTCITHLNELKPRLELVSKDMKPAELETFFKTHAKALMETEIARLEKHPRDEGHAR